MKEFFVSIISAIIGAVISAVVNLYIQKRKEKREDKEKVFQHKKEIFDSRPKYKIIGYKDYINRVGYGIKQQCDIDAFLTSIIAVKTNNGVEAFYREENFNITEWCGVIYTLENVGKTDILVTDLVCNHQRTKALFNSHNANEFLKMQSLNYSVMLDKEVRSGETITIKLCYHKSHVIESVIDAILAVVVKDANGNYWKQPLFAPFNKIYDSYRISHEDYRSFVTTEAAEECFKSPWKW